MRANCYKRMLRPCHMRFQVTETEEKLQTELPARVKFLVGGKMNYCVEARNKSVAAPSKRKRAILWIIFGV